MTEIAPARETPPDYLPAVRNALPSTGEMRTALELASRIAQTEFVPKGLRGKPDAILAAVMTGREMGVGPMTAMSKIYIVEGKPTQSAELMRALVLRDGHELWFEELTDARVVVCGQRAGQAEARATKVTWTMEDARRAGVATKGPWKSYPKAMLTARATSDLCRAIFADCLAGVSYTPEELGAPVAVTDDGGVEVVIGEVVRDVSPWEQHAAPLVEAAKDAGLDPQPWIEATLNRAGVTDPTWLLERDVIVFCTRAEQLIAEAAQTVVAEAVEEMPAPSVDLAENPLADYAPSESAA